MTAGLTVWLGFLYVFLASANGRVPGCKEPRLSLNTVIIATTRSPTSGVFPPGATVTTQCVAGHVTKRGQSKRTCRRGRWTGFPLACRKKEVECPEPIPPIGGYVTRHSGANAGSVRFSCLDGLEIEGQVEASCLPSGQWSAPAPRCRRTLKCQDPGELPNSVKTNHKRFDLEDFEPGDYVKYTCNPGYLIAGFDEYKEMRCLVHGEWEVGFGNCEAVRCRPPESVFMGTHYPVKDSYNYQESVTYQCLENHEVIGPATLTCDRYGEWSGYTPYCRAVTCPDPSQPEHGRRIGSSFFVGDTVKFKCMTGFTLMGSQNRTCLPNAQWSGVLTICEKGDSDCPDPGTPIGAVKVGKSYNIGDTVTFTCGSDFFLEGSANRVCLKNGMWSGTETYCRYKYSYRDPEEAAILFGEKLDRISIETSDSKLGAKLRENLTLVHDNSTGRAINIGYQFGVDLYILVDVSGSISSEALNITKEFCKAIVDKVGVSRKIDGTRVTLISFSGNFEELVTLHDEQTPEAVIAKIDEMGKIRGSNATATTLAMERVEDFIASRKIQALGTKALSAVILLTDGKHNMYGSPVAVANRMKTDYGTDMYTIGIGVDVDEEILQNMASPGQYIRLKHIHDLEGITVFLLNGSIGYEECGVGGLKDLPAYQDLEDYVTAKDIQNWPWMAGLYVDGNRDQTYSDFICGASLIRPQWLLTAAHCFPKKKYLYPADWQARMGSLSRVTNDGIPLDIAEIIIHPDYTNTPNEQNDVALIRLVDPVILSPTIRTVCLPNNLPQFEVDQNQAWYKAGRWSVVSGWGDVRVRKPTDSGVILQEELKFTAMRVQSDETCDATKVNPLLRYTQNMYCAGDGKRRDTCAGDSGGPSVVELPVSYQSKRVFQIGIVSWGFGCRQEGMYGYYVRLEKFLPWILEKVDPPQS